MFKLYADLENVPTPTHSAAYLVTSCAKQGLLTTSPSQFLVQEEESVSMFLHCMEDSYFHADDELAAALVLIFSSRGRGLYLRDSAIAYGMRARTCSPSFLSCYLHLRLALYTSSPQTLNRGSQTTPSRWCRRPTSARTSSASSCYSGAKVTARGGVWVGCWGGGVASPQARPPSEQTGKWSTLAVPINNEVGDLLVVGLMDGKHFMKRRAHHLFLRDVGDTPERKR